MTGTRSLPKVMTGLVLAVLSVVSCGPSQQRGSVTNAQATTRAPPEMLVDPRLISPDFLWRQRLTATYGEDSFKFDAVVEKSAATLRVLFLTPYGTRALLLSQVGSEVRTEYFVPQRLPFPARYILGDIHRVFFRGFADRNPTTGIHEQRLGREVFRDTWRDAALVSRVVTLAQEPGANASDGGREPARISVRYSPAFHPGSPPARVRLDNDWYGYEIEIETLSSP
jgi:hypothetical protein